MGLGAYAHSYNQHWPVRVHGLIKDFSSLLSESLASTELLMIVTSKGTDQTEVSGWWSG